MNENSSNSWKEINYLNQYCVLREACFEKADGIKICAYQWSTTLWFILQCELSVCPLPRCEACFLHVYIVNYNYTNIALSLQLLNRKMIQWILPYNAESYITLKLNLVTDNYYVKCECMEVSMDVWERLWMYWMLFVIRGCPWPHKLEPWISICQNIVNNKP